MHKAFSLRSRMPYPKRILAVLIAAAIESSVPQFACAQPASATARVKQSDEVDRLLEDGGQAYRSGQLTEATALYEKALAVSSRDLGKDHPDTLIAMNNLALTYSDLGLHDKALVLQEQTLNLQRATLGADHPDTLTAMSNLAATYTHLGHLDKALALEEPALQLNRARLGDEHPDVLSSMNNLAVTYRLLGRHDRALALQDQALKLQRATLGAEHPDTLLSMINLAQIHRALGQHDKAVVLLEQVGSLRRVRYGEDDPYLLISMNDLALTYGDLSQYDKTLSLQQEVLRLQRTKLGDDHPNTLTAANNLALTYGYLGQHDKALELYEQALRLCRAKLGDDHPTTLTLMNNLAMTYRALGKHDKALEQQERAVKLQRAKLGEDHPDTLAVMNNLAATYLDLGQYEKALAQFERILKLERAKLGEDHPNTMLSMINLAEAYKGLGQLDKALAVQERALTLQRAKLGDDHPSTLTAMSNLAMIYRDLGHGDKALELTEQTLKLRRAKLGDDHPSTLNSMNNLAVAYQNSGQNDKAAVLNEQTLKLQRAKFGEDHPNTLLSKHNLALSYQSVGQIEHSLQLVPSIVAGVEKLRDLPGLASEQRQSVFEKYSDRYQSYAKWYADSGRFADAFDVADLSKARTLTDSIKAQTALRSLPLVEQEKLQASEFRARQMQAQIEQLDARGARDPQAILTLQSQLNAWNVQHRQLVSELKLRYPKFRQLSELKPATAKLSRELLGTREVFVSYLVNTQGGAQAFVLDASGEPKWVKLGQIPNLAKTVAAYRELVSPSRQRSRQGRLIALKDGGYDWMPFGYTSSGEATRSFKAKGDAGTAAGAAGGTDDSIEALKVLDRYWHDTLIKPILPFAGGFKRWIVSPDKDLALLPFDVLPEAYDERGEPTLRLVETRKLSLVQSFSVFALLKHPEAEYAHLERPKDLLAMGNAVYDNGWAEERGIRRGSERGFEAGEAPGEGAAPLSARAEQNAIGRLEWRNLPGTAREIETVTAVFGAPAAARSRVDTYVGPDASEGKLLQLNEASRLKDYRYLLFSAHGYLAQNPALSSLVLSQRGNPPGIDGYVTASEWPLYDVKSDLTVLSACDTGVGKTQAGESVMGLPYALFVAGNKNTLLSLWPVDDEATAEFMRRFFARLKSGGSQADGLRETKEDFLRHPRWHQPKFWAAFVLYGV